MVPCPSSPWPRVRRRFLWGVVGGLPLVPWAFPSESRAAEESFATPSPLLEVRAEGAGCPDAALLEAQLEPLLADSPPAEGGAEKIIATVVDLGPRYAVLVTGEPREVEDPDRNCLERARAAAVLIVLGMRTEGGQRADETPPGDTAPADAASAGPAGAPDTELLLQLLGGLEHARELPPTPAASFGGILSRAPWRVGLNLGVVAPVTLGADGDGGRFRLLRLPAVLTGAHLWELGNVQLGPGLGLAVEGLQFQGVDTPGATGGWRWNVGAVGAATGRLRVSGWAIVFEARAAVFPRAYEAWVEPDRDLGASPRWWLGTYLGVERAWNRTTGAL